MITCHLFLWLAVWTVLSSNQVTDGKRVVVMPMATTSHTKYMAHVAQALARQGHEVWVTMPDYIVNKRVLDTTNFTVIELSAFPNNEDFVKSLVEKYFKGQQVDIQIFSRNGKEFCDRILGDKSLFEEIKALSPDFFVLDNLAITTMLAIIPYRLGVPFAFVGTVYEPNIQRIPVLHCNMPSVTNGFSHPRNFYKSIVSSLDGLSFAVEDPYVYNDAVSRYAPEMPYLPMDMLTARAEIWLVETDHILDYPKPTMPNVKLIGGTATGPGKPLPPKFKHFMDDAEEGVVIVSFGSQVLSPPTSITQKFLKVLTDLPFKSIFLSNTSSPNSDKILTSSWIPQNDLLAHPNTRVFVSHCDELYTTIVQVATNKSYKQAITKASELFKIEFGVPVEKAAFWLDHVMKYGGDHLRSSGQELPFYQFACLDVYGFFLVCVLLTLLTAVCSFYVVCRYIYMKSKRKKD
ncbi:hypothetical protein C0Q70_00879 [Pomacea canaliculata]|uniref:Glucuronosyltransferase n=1 Tax=Pomacea canaliculata TaxID=400727 RepID=A0A2T7PXY9_POMCA|nr:hypothetical protein C0Q70_00879 [Pomacea canaliculata]